MKKLFILTLAILSLAIVSCSESGKNLPSSYVRVKILESGIYAPATLERKFRNIYQLRDTVWVYNGETGISVTDVVILDKSIKRRGNFLLAVIHKM